MKLKQSFLYIALCAFISFGVSRAALAQDDLDISAELEGLPPGLVEDLVQTRERVIAEVASETDPARRADAWGALAMIYHAQHMLHAAEDAYRRAFTEKDDYKWHYLTAVIMLGRGESERALAHLDQTVLHEPDYAPAWQRLGRLLLEKGEIAAANRALSRAHDLTPNSAGIKVALADVAVAEDRLADALELLDRAWVLAPAAGQIAYKIAMLKKEQGDEDSATEWLARMAGDTSLPQIDDPMLVEVAAMSQNSRFFAKAGEWAIARGDREAAIEAYANATRLEPENLDFAERYATMLYFSGQPGLAISEAKRMTAISIDSVRGWYLLAWILRASPDPEQYLQGLVAIRRALTIADDDRNRTLAAAMSMGAGRFEDAKNDYFTLIERHPENPYYYYWFGLSRLAAGECEGREALKRAVAFRKEWGEAHLVLARADSFCGDHEAATMRLEVLNQIKDDRDTRLALAFVEINQGIAENAKQLAEAELPHPDAQMILNALDAGSKPERLFELGSEWWIPPELQ